MTGDKRRLCAPQSAVVDAVADEEGMRRIEQRPHGSTRGHIVEAYWPEDRLVCDAELIVNRDTRLGCSAFGRQSRVHVNN